MFEQKSSRPRHCPLPANRPDLTVPVKLRDVEPGQSVDILPSRGGRVKGVNVVKHTQTKQAGNGRTTVEIGGERQELSWRTSCVLR